jgi:DNA-binding beta-propeller fold protein YncE
VSAQEDSPAGVAFSGDGTKMFVTGYNTDSVYRYDLTPAPVTVTGTVAYTEDDDTFAATGTAVPPGVAVPGPTLTVRLDSPTSTLVLDRPVTTAVLDRPTTTRSV